ncbi:MAG: hypothetical protein H6Q73_1601 [Firmicutes bacterium]|nr:hypothetical protein [Bacillota bacterium]
MIDFKTIKLSDKEWIDKLLVKANKRGCEYTFTNMFVWSNKCNVRVAKVNDYLVVKLNSAAGISYMYPAGNGESKPVLLEMKKDAEENKHDFLLIGVDQESVGELESLFPNSFEYSEEQFSFDYLYYIDKLADLPGKKLHAKRNHINRFIENNHSWSFEPITQDNIHECYTMDQEWYKLNQENQYRNPLDEGGAIKSALDNYAGLKLEGGMLRSNGRVIAFALGGKINEDTYDVHFEEAFKDINGSYAMINREFARYVREKYPEVIYINREDDLGLEGLRKAKQSYYPDLMIKKHSVIYLVNSL